jgi:hypothetical protein
MGSSSARQAEYALNFVFVALVDPVTFSVCDIVRRLAVIVAGAPPLPLTSRIACFLSPSWKKIIFSLHIPCGCHSTL